MTQYPRIVCATQQHLKRYWLPTLGEILPPELSPLLSSPDDLAFLQPPPPPPPPRPSEQRRGFLFCWKVIEHGTLLQPCPAFVWGRVPVSGTTISGARPVPLITERRWISVRAQSTSQLHPLTTRSPSTCWRSHGIQVNCRRAFPVRPWPWRSDAHLPSVHFDFAETRGAVRIQSFCLFFSEVLLFFFISVQEHLSPRSLELSSLSVIQWARRRTQRNRRCQVSRLFFSLSPVTTTSLFFSFFKTACCEFLCQYCWLLC